MSPINTLTLLKIASLALVLTTAFSSTLMAAAAGVETSDSESTDSDPPKRHTCEPTKAESDSHSETESESDSDVPNIKPWIPEDPEKQKKRVLERYEDLMNKILAPRRTPEGEKLYQMQKKIGQQKAAEEKINPKDEKELDDLSKKVLPPALQAIIAEKIRISEKCPQWRKDFDTINKRLHEQYIPDEVRRVAP